PLRCGASRRTVEAKLRGRATDSARLERRAFERDRRRIRAYLRVLSAEDARDSERSLRIRDHECSLRKDPINSVKRAKRFAAARLPGNKDAATELPVVVRVKRLSELEHDVIGAVHDVVERAHPRRGRPRLHPGRPRTDA